MRYRCALERKLQLIARYFQCTQLASGGIRFTNKSLFNATPNSFNHSYNLRHSMRLPLIAGLSKTNELAGLAIQLGIQLVI